MLPSRTHILAPLAATAAAGCLEPIETGEGFEPMCEVQQDCDTAAGEVCEAGVCWGNPPQSTRFAARLIPPEERPDLAPTEIPELEIDPDGITHGLEIDTAIRVEGRVILACGDLGETTACGEDVSVPALIHITRPSAIPGGPRFSRTVTAQGGLAPGEQAFAIYLPPTGPGAPPYEVTIRPTAPEPAVRSQQAVEAIAPPLHTTLSVEQDRTDIVWVLGDPAEHVELTGRVTDAAGRGIPGRLVYAVGLFAGAAEPGRVSTTATTDDQGSFRLRAPLALDGLVDVVSRPPPGEVAPRLTVRGVDLLALAEEVIEPIELPELVMPSYPSPTRFAVPVDGSDPSGGKVPVVEAKVTFETVLATDGGVEALFSTSATTDDEGVAHLELIPAGELNRSYTARITTPSGSVHASSHNLDIAVGPGSGDQTSFLAAVSLPRRVLVDGEVGVADGTPVAGAQIEAKVSPSLVWRLDTNARALAEEHRIPTTTSDESGLFLLWLDPVIADRAAVYDLVVVPPVRVREPRWSLDGLDVGTGAAAQALGQIELPQASHARGVVMSGDEPIGGAEVFLYELGMDGELCDAVYAPGGEDCEPPARLRGLWRTDDDGSVWLVLPNPE